MKKYIIYLIFAFLSGGLLHSQVTSQNFVGLSTDSLEYNKDYKIDINTSSPVLEAEVQSYTYTEDLYPSHIPNSFSINRTKSVGEIPITTQLTPSGSFEANVPIDICPDPKGFQPQVSLKYNSLSGNGPLGSGWNISAYSIITRGNKSVYYDNKSEGITSYSKESAFYLDGMRLIKISEDDYVIKFQTEQGNIKVEGHWNMAPEYISYFKVYYPNGNKAIFGFQSWKGEALDYPLTEMENPLGQKIVYEYRHVNNTLQLSNILYGKELQASVKFEYEDRNMDIYSFYRGGEKVIYDYLLKHIIVKLNGNFIRQYSLGYEDHFGDKRHILKNISCQGLGANTFNSLYFYHGDGNQVSEFKNKDIQLSSYFEGFENPNSYRTGKGKFEYGTDNDGIIIFKNKIHYVQHYYDGGIGAHSNRGIQSMYNGNEDILIATGLSGQYLSQSKILQTEEGFVDIFSMDVDDIPGEEIIKINNVVENGRDIVRVQVYTPNIYAIGGIAHKYTRSFDAGLALEYRDRKSINPKFYYQGDFNGDGRMELLVISIDNALDLGRNTECYLLDLENNNILYTGNPFAYKVTLPTTQSSSKTIDAEMAYRASNKLYPMDYDGDGKTDLCLIKDEGTYIYTFDSDNKDFKQVTFLSEIKNYGNVVDRICLLGDFNSDGKTDLFISPYLSSSMSSNISSDDIWTLFISKGDGTFEKNQLSIRKRMKDDQYLLQDMDGDGQPDLIEARTISDEMFLSVFFFKNGRQEGSSYTAIPQNTIIIPTNIQSRNYFNKLVSINNKGIASLVSYQNDLTKKYLVTGIINSLGHITKIGYQKINEEESHTLYQMGMGATYPYQNFQGGLNVVSRIENYLYDKKLDKITYQYENAVIHKTGLGFRGFEKVIMNNEIKNISFTQHFDPYNFSVLKSEESPFGKASYDYTFDVEKNKIAKILLDNKEETDKLKGITVKSSYGYDSYGNPIEEKIDFGDRITSSTSTKLSNIDTDAIYLLGRLDEQSVKNTRGGSSVVSKTAISYNEKHLPVSKIAYYNNNKTSEESYVYYDNMDLKESKAKTYSSDNWLTTKYEYDTQGRIKRETDPYGFYIDYTYNNKGQLESTKNYLGHITSYTYDNWGRNIQTNYPDGAIETSTLEWASSPTGALYVAKSTMTGQPDAETYYDALGREIRKGAKRFDGTYLYTDNKYDSKGRLEKTSLPFKGNTASLWNTYSYDGYDRITSLTYASGKKDSYSYNKLQTTSVTDGISVTKTEDATGQVIKIKDEAGIIAYSYRPDGQLKYIIAPGNIKTSFVYDRYGRQTMLKDPSAGDKSYEYDDAGNITKETDADGKTIQMKYDTYNRLVSKEVSGGSTATYTYDTNSLLTGISNADGTSKTYTYDNLLRLKTEKETIVDNNYLEKSYAYSGNMLSSVSYGSQSGNIVTENYYYNNGHHTETKLNGNTSIWKLTAENALGMPTASVTGELNRTYTYDNYGMPTGRGIKKGNTTIQNFGYNFDPTTGNLNWRKDNTRNLTENFGYDSMNRLTDFSGNTIVYNKRGNITDHSGVGYFGYSKDKPYAIEGVSPYEEVIPMRDQHISYNALMRPDSISEGEYKAALLYDIDGSRIKMHLKKGDNDELVRYYMGGQYEIDHTLAGIEERLYLDGDAYSAAAVYVRKGSNPWQVHYIGRDYLGSITHITDATGNLKEEYSYDPWGRLRNPQNHALYEADQDPALLLARGYTGHEHLPMFGLINMNARLYDPVVGRFLSPDPYVQAPYMSQNFNRYSYALNNPLRYTDPNGEFLHIVLGGFIGGTANLVYKAATGQINSWQDGVMAFGIGAVAGAVGAATGGAAFIAAGGGAAGAGGFIAGAWGGIMGYMGSAPLQNLGNHLYFGDPLMSPGEHAIGLTFSGITGGVTNGLAAKINNKNVWTGNDIQPGRSAFSINNTPKIQAPAKVEPLGQQLLDAPKQKTPTLNASKNNVTEYTINYEAAGSTKYAPDGIKIDVSIPRPEIKGYNPALELKTDLYHNFPKEFDNLIIKHGGWNGTISNTSLKGHWFELPGTINGKAGMYQIGINTKGIIYHKHFRPIR